MRRHLVTATLVLALAGCGSTDDTGPTSSEGSGPEQSSSGGGGSSGSSGGGGDPSGGDGGSPGGDGGSSGDGDEETGEVLADGTDAVLDLAFGRLDAATYDGRSQCLLDTDDVEGQAGLRPANRALMLADRQDIWTVCLTSVQAPDGATLTVTDPAGTTWGSGTLVPLDDVEPERNLGYGQTGTQARGLSVSDGSTLWPVGHTYRRTAPDGTTRHVSTAYLALPDQRPGGAWTIAVTDGAGTHQLPLESPTCGASTTATRSPWPIEPGLRVVTFTEERQWHETDDQQALLAGFSAVEHCLAAPPVVGQTWEQAGAVLADAGQEAGLPGSELTTSVSCGTDAERVTRQSPVPNGILGGPVNLEVWLSCPPMPDLVGMTVAQSEQALTAMADPPYTVTATVSTGCSGADAVVARTYPAAGDTAYRSGGSELVVDLSC